MASSVTVQLHDFAHVIPASTSLYEQTNDGKAWFADAQLLTNNTDVTFDACGLHGNLMQVEDQLLLMLRYETNSHDRTIGTCIMGVLPPHSSGRSPASLNSCFTLSGLAPSLSTCRFRPHYKEAKPNAADTAAAQT